MTHQLSAGALRYLLVGSILIAIIVMSLILYGSVLRPLPTFSTTFSPGGRYEVYLKGQKTRPIFFTTQVRFDVFRDGREFVSHKFLYSADSEDLPFAFRYPNQRWISEQSLQFYRDENSSDRATDTLVVVNSTGRTIKYLKIESSEITLIFEVAPGFKDTIATSRPKADSRWFDVVGEFSDGTSLKGVTTDIPIRNTSKNETFYLDLRPDGTRLEVSHQ